MAEVTAERTRTKVSREIHQPAQEPVIL